MTLWERSSHATPGSPASGTWSAAWEPCAGKQTCAWWKKNGPKRITVSGSNLEEFLGVRRYLPDRLPRRTRWDWLPAWHGLA